MPRKSIKNERTEILQDVTVVCNFLEDYAESSQWNLMEYIMERWNDPEEIEKDLQHLDQKTIIALSRHFRNIVNGFQVHGASLYVQEYLEGEIKMKNQHNAKRENK